MDRPAASPNRNRQGSAVGKGSPKTVPWPLSKALAWFLTWTNSSHKKSRATIGRRLPRNSMENCSRAISVALCSWTAVLVMNLNRRTRTRTRPSEASPMMSCCPFLRLYQITRGPLESWQRLIPPQRKKHQRETGARLSLDQYLRRQWLSAFEEVKGGIVDGTLEAWADDEILPPYVASTLRITPHPLDERFPLDPNSPWLLRPNEALTESAHKKRGSRSTVISC